MSYAKNTLPVLIYDGDCDICCEWVSYWHKLTGEAVVYRPYQEAAPDYPNISLDAFEASIQYIEPNGAIASGAEACLILLRNSCRYRILYWLYRNLPGFSILCEWSYTFFSRHRGLLRLQTHLLWGKKFEPPRYEITTWIFFRCLACIYFAAFTSLAVQIKGLIGTQGILPLEIFLERVSTTYGNDAYFKLPTIFWFHLSDNFLEWICIAGTVFATILFFNILLRTSLIVLYVLYLSLFYAGQDFLTFQWDILLLETGFLALFLPTRSHIIIWLFRWLLFRFMFLGGVVKIASRDPVWDNLTALNYHFETQPLPTTLAWYAHHLSDAVHMTLAATTLIIELVIPFLVFLPRKIRFIAAYCFIIFQLGILLTGNYNFFNLLTIALCLFLFDDAAIRWLLPLKIRERLTHITVESALPWKSTFIAMGIACLVIAISASQFYRIFTDQSLPVINRIAQQLNPFHIVNLYGPFAIMTTRRLEIIIEGSNDNDNWKEYKFKYKPDDLKKIPARIIPHQPRLDWQIWFAALGRYDRYQWFEPLIQRLLQGSPDVLKLLQHNPFPATPPRYIRALSYQYHFTDPEERAVTQQWWTREFTGVYYPVTEIKASQ